MTQTLLYYNITATQNQYYLHYFVSLSTNSFVSLLCIFRVKSFDSFILSFAYPSYSMIFQTFCRTMLRYSVLQLAIIVCSVFILLSHISEIDCNVVGDLMITKP